MGENLKALEEFYEYYKGKAGEDFQMDFGDFCRVCRTPFRFLKKEMTDGTLDPYRLQYLGTFTIPENRIKFWKIATLIVGTAAVIFAANNYFKD